MAKYKWYAIYFHKVITIFIFILRWLDLPRMFISSNWILKTITIMFKLPWPMPAVIICFIKVCRTTLNNINTVNSFINDFPGKVMQCCRIDHTKHFCLIIWLILLGNLRDSKEIKCSWNADCFLSLMWQLQWSEKWLSTIFM